MLFINYTQIIHNQMKMFALFFPVIKFFIHYLFIYVCLSFFQPWWCSINNQWEIGTEIFRITGKQNINHAVFNIELTISEMLQRLSVNMDVTPGGVLGISSDGDDQRIFWGLKFSIPGFFWVWRFGKYYFG